MRGRRSTAKPGLSLGSLAALCLGLAGPAGAAGDAPRPSDSGPYYPMGISYPDEPRMAFNYLQLPDKPAKGDRAAVWLVVVFKTPQTVGDMTISRIAFLEGLDCPNARDRRIADVVYGRDGEVLIAENSEGDWNQGDPDSLQGDVIGLGCGTKSPWVSPLPDIGGVLKDAAARAAGDK